MVISYCTAGGRLHASNTGGRAASEREQMGVATAAEQLALVRVWWVGLGGPGHPSPSLTSAGGGLLAKLMPCCFVFSVLFHFQ